MERPAFDSGRAISVEGWQVDSRSRLWVVGHERVILKLQGGDSLPDGLREAVRVVPRYESATHLGWADGPLGAFVLCDAGGDDFWIFYTYNPPRTLWSWVNREELERERRADTLVRRSSYLDVVGTHPEWLGAPFVEETEYLREVDERAWRSEYLGEVAGTGGSVFGNVVGRRLTDAQCRDFSRTRNGVDWGWFPDPWRFVRCGWVPGERRLFLFEELSANRKTPAETGAMAAEALTFSDEPGGDAHQHDELIWADDTPDGK